MFGDQKRSSKKDLRVRVRSILSQIEERELVRKSELVSSNLHRLFSGDSTLDKVIPSREESFFFGGRELKHQVEVWEFEKSVLVIYS